jgi:hypothetical protein
MNYVFIGSEEYYNYGKVIDKTGDNYLLVRFNPTVGPPTLKLFSLSFLSDNDDVFFFDYEEELDAWVNWLETPNEETAKFKVLQFKKDKA